VRQVWVPRLTGHRPRGRRSWLACTFTICAILTRLDHRRLIREVLQAERLGHRLGGVAGMYSHTIPVMQMRLPLPAGSSEKALLAV
jgi:hypothetical protein